MSDWWHEKCALFGVFGHPEASNLTYLGLYAQQHRGQEGAGIISLDEKGLHVYKKKGLVADVFSEEVLMRLSGFAAIGHTRYSTYGSKDVENLQPMLFSACKKELAIAHNGSILNYPSIKAMLMEKGIKTTTSVDSEVFGHLINVYNGLEISESFYKIMKAVHGAYSVLVLTGHSILAFRDPFGFRPLCIGKLNNASVIASESCAFDLIGAEFVSEVKPGEVVEISKDGIKRYRIVDLHRHAKCIFELVYFSRPDSYVFGKNVYKTRKALGAKLFQEFHVNADIIVPVPDSGVPAAIGFHEASSIPFEMALIRNHYVGRTFIEPKQSIRSFGVKIKLNPVRGAVDGKSIVLVDDSLVRGTTLRKITTLLRNNGAREIHVRITSPHVVSPCYFGIDTPSKEELLASKIGHQQIADFIGSDSISYLSVEGMLEACKMDAKESCTACFTGNYPLMFESQ